MVKYWVIVLLISSLVPSPALAVMEHHGEVTFSGLPVPGAVITAGQSDKKFTTVTDEEGFYSFPNLADGVWTFKVEMIGFAKMTRDITISATAEPAKWELAMLPMAEIKPDIIRVDAAPRAE